MDVTREVSVWTVLVVLGAMCVGAQAAWSKDRFKEETGQIFKLIFHKYNRWVRPPQQYVNVSVELKVDRINHLDALREELEAVVGMEMIWYDSRLTWSPQMVHQITADTGVVWTPDLVFLNSVSPSKPLLPGVLKVKDNGIVSWTRREVVSTSCETDLSAERQSCYLRLGFVSNIRERQDDRFIDQDNSFVVTSDNLKTHEWDLHSMQLDFDTDNDTSLPFQMDVEIVVERTAGYATDGTRLRGNSAGACCPGGDRNSASRQPQGGATQSQHGGRVVCLAVFILALVHGSGSLLLGSVFEEV